MEFRFSFLFHLMIVLAAGTLAACHPDVITPEEGAEVPQSWKELVAAHAEGREYIGTTVAGSFSKVFFSGYDIIVPKADLDIENCCGGADPKELVCDPQTNEWLVGGQPSGVFKTMDKTEACFPVYAWFNEKQLNLFAGNGRELVFDNIYYKEPDPEPPTPPTPPEPVVPYEIPRIYVNTQGQAPVVDKENYVPGTIRVEDPSCTFADEAVFEAPMKIRGRGNSTWGMPKKPYKIKLEEKHGILGMPKDKEWCLLANYADKSLLRNIVAMEISRRLSFSWTPRMVSVESESSLCKYNNNSEFGIIDNKTLLDLEDDAAHINWGGNWRTPTLIEMQELLDNCTASWEILHDGGKSIYGVRFTSNKEGYTGISIFLPAAGYRSGESTIMNRSSGLCWSTSLSLTNPNLAYYLSFDSGGNVNTLFANDRYYGLTIRPVCP